MHVLCTGKERKISSILWFTPEVPTTSRPKQGAENSIRVSIIGCRVARSQVCEPPSTASQDALAEGWFGSSVARIQLSTLMWNAGTARGSSIC